MPSPLTAVEKISKNRHDGGFPSHETFWFEIPKVSFDELNSVLRNFKKSGEPPEVNLNFLSISKFSEIWLNEKHPQLSA